MPAANGNVYDSGMRGNEKRKPGVALAVTLGIPRPPGSRDPIKQDAGGTDGDLAPEAARDPLVVSGMRKEAPNVARIQGLTSDLENGVNEGGGRSMEEMAPPLRYIHDDEGNLVVTIPKPVLGLKQSGLPPAERNQSDRLPRASGGQTALQAFNNG